MNEVSEEDRVVFHAIVDSSDSVKVVAVDFTMIDELNLLFTSVSNILNGAQEQRFVLSEILKVNVMKEESQVLPLITNSTLPSLKTLDIYDFIISVKVVEEKHG